jgi:FrmR/RcnR family transcriptional regulator, repressor of frmRAB operon
MAHTIRNKQKLVNRVRRLRGQIEAVEKAIEAEQDCFAILQTVAACRGAINGLMAEIMEDHIRYHLLSPDRPPQPREVQAAEELIEVVKTYLK